MGFRGFSIVLLLGFQFKIYTQPYPIEEGVNRIVFIGNSITYAGDYINFIDAYFTTHHPQKKYAHGRYKPQRQRPVYQYRIKLSQSANSVTSSASTTPA